MVMGYAAAVSQDFLACALLQHKTNGMAFGQQYGRDPHIIFGHCTVLCPHTCTNYAIILCMFSYRPSSKLDALKQTVMVLKCTRQKHVYFDVLIHSGTHNPHSEPTSPMLSYRTDLFVDVVKTRVPKASSMSKTSEIQKRSFRIRRMNGQCPCTEREHTSMSSYNLTGLWQPR